MNGLIVQNDVAAWLTMASQNIAMGVVLVLIYRVIRDLAPRYRAAMEPALVGVLFGCGAVASMYFPIHLPAGGDIDARPVFVLVGSLIGGPIGGTIAALMSIWSRILISGPLALPGVLSALSTAAFGICVHRHFGDGTRDLSFKTLFAVGVGNVLLAAVIVDTVFALRPAPLLPLGLVVILTLVYSSSTVLLVNAMNMTHYRAWRRTQLQLNDMIDRLVAAEKVGRLGVADSNRIDDTVSWSEELRPLLGLPPGATEFTSPQSVRLIVGAAHPDDQPMLHAAIEQLRYQGEDVAPFDFRVALPHGEVRWLYRKSEVIRGLDNVPTRIVTIYQDVTSRKRSELDLAAAQREMQAIMDNTVDGLITIKEDGTLLAFSKPATRIFGYAADEVIGSNIETLMASSGPEPIGARLESCLARAGDGVAGTSLELSGRRKDGSVFPMDMVLGEIPGQTKKRRFVGTVRDVSARKQAEQQLERAQQLEALGNIAGGVAHDFNNILGAILGLAGFLVQDLDPDSTQHRFAAQIKGAGERGKSLVRQIMEFSRKGKSEYAPISVATTITETCEMLRASLPANTTLMLSNDLPKAIVLADRAQLAQAVMNLIVNANDALSGKNGQIDVAIRAFDRGRTEIAYCAANAASAPSVVCEPLAWSDERGTAWLAVGRVPAGPALSITVTDDGAGIPFAERAKIFDAFFSTKPKGKGTGLGLAIVQRTVMQHKGAILVKTAIGQGTTFEIILSAVQGSERAIESVPSTPPAQVACVAKKSSVLLVDDDDMFCDMVELALTRSGYCVDVVRDSREGVKLIESRAKPWDILVSDFSMPFIQGDEVVDRFRLHYPDAKTVMFSGFMRTTGGITPANADAFLRKPFETSELLSVIGKLLAPRRR